MKPTQLFTIFSVVLLTLPVVVFAQLELYRDWWNPQIFADVLKVPVDWLTTPSNFLYRLLIPFLVAFTVVYGLLEELGIFRHAYHRGKINFVLAFAMSFLLLPAGILTLIVSVFYAGGAFIGVMGFGILFITGVWFWSRGTYYRTRAEGVAGQVIEINRKIEKYENELNRLIKKTNKSDRDKLKMAELKNLIEEEKEAKAILTK